MNQPKITIIIPTRERCDVLESSLRTATAQNYDNLEIIVSDNASQDETRDVVKRINDQRIRYVNTGKRLSMSHNWEFALSHVEDGWVTFMGDDDGLLPQAISTVADVISGTGALAIRSNFCTYDWPGMPDRDNGQLIVPMGTGTEIRNSALWLSKVLHGKAKYNQLPMIYNGGFIHVGLLAQIRDRLGAVFMSANPDVFTAIALAKITENYLYLHTPLSISGTSKHSNGHSSFSTSAKRDAAPYQKFLDEATIPFHPDVPLRADGSYPLSLQACVYEAYLQAKPLGDSSPGIDHSQQIAVILATAGKHRLSVEEWGARFAALHAIDYPTTKRIAALHRRQLQPIALGRKIMAAFNSVISETLPIKNIHEASIAAAIIRQSPGRLDTFGFMAREFTRLFK